MRKIVHIIGARPNFMKAAPLISQLKKNRKFQQVIVHTGQHFDKKMSDVFCRTPLVFYNLDDCWWSGQSRHSVK